MDDDRMSDVERRNKKSLFVFFLLPPHPEKKFLSVETGARDGKSYQNGDDL